MRTALFCLFLLVIIMGCNAPTEPELRAVLLEAVLRSGEPIVDIKVSVSNLSDDSFEAFTGADVTIIRNGSAASLTVSEIFTGYYYDAHQQVVVKPGDTLTVEVNALENKIKGSVIVPQPPAWLNISHDKIDFSSADTLMAVLTFPASSENDLMLFVYRRFNDNVGRQLVLWRFVLPGIDTIIIEKEYFMFNGHYDISLECVSGMPSSWIVESSMAGYDVNPVTTSIENGFGYVMAFSGIERSIEVIGMEEVM
ncbi:DUF4249 family protein [bacterium]|nr:DUF4249 family protein [bacterium]